MNPHRRFPTRSTLAAAFLAAALLAGCGDDPADPATSQSTGDPDQASTGDAVTIADSRFGPDRLVVPVGTEVTFENVDPFAHTVTSADDAGIEFDSGALTQSETFVQSFDTAGSYAYFCEVHPTMRAEIVVTDD